MAIGARPLDDRGVRAVIDAKLRDFSHVAGAVVVRHVDVDVYLEAAREDPDVAFALQAGLLEDLERLRDPVLARFVDRLVFTCPPLAVRVLSSEPAEIHRPFVEGAFLRKFFQFFVPASFEGGSPLEVREQVREIMRKHFALQLIVTETILGVAA